MPRRLVRLSEVSEGRDNNFNLIRIIAAFSVLVSHAWSLTLGPEAVEPLRTITGFNLGTLAVFAFFAISGFLVTRSFERRRSTRQWILARALRIFPGLAVALILTTLVLGPLVTELPLDRYFSDPATFSYVPLNLTLVYRQVSLPGVFEALPYAHLANGSLWTLYFEVLCYAAVLAIGLVGGFRSRLALLFVGALFFLANLALVVLPTGAIPVVMETFLFLAVPFAVGMAFYFTRSWLPLTPWALPMLLGLAFAARSTPLDLPFLVLALSYGVFLLAFLPRGWVRRYNRLGDYSFGVYVFAWPTQQTADQLFGPMGPVSNILIAAPVVLALAWASWTFIERPTLDLVPRLGQRLGKASLNRSEASA